MSNSRWLLVGVGLAALASQLHLAWLLAPLRPNLLCLQLSFDPAGFWDIIAAWGEPGLARFRAHFAWDYLHPFLYGAFGYLLVATTPLVPPDAPRRRALLRAALPLAALCDLAENTLQLRVLALGPGLETWLVPLAASCASLKWLLVVGFTLGIAQAAWRRCRGGAARTGR